MTRGKSIYLKPEARHACGRSVFFRDRSSKIYYNNGYCPCLYGKHRYRGQQNERGSHRLPALDGRPARRMLRST